MTNLLRRFLIMVSLLTGHVVFAQQYVLDTLAGSPNIALPVVIAFSPDNSGKFFFTEKNSGRVMIYDQTGLRTNPFLTLAITNDTEQGLLGIALHPEYPDSPYVYVFFTRTGDRANQVVRYRDAGNVGVEPDTIVVVPRLNAGPTHNGGNVHFGPDGKLYVTFGDNAFSANAQDTSATNLRGKIVRLNLDGSIPADNPFPGKPFWSIGHRNSFDFTFDPLTGKMYCSENGPQCDDEVNRVPRGANMGWPVEGNCTYTNNPLYTRPLYYFPTPPLPALTGIAVYRATAFPRLRGKLIFGGNNDNATIWTLTLSANGDTIVPNSLAALFTYSTGFVDIEIGPDGNIYMTNGPYVSDRILRLRPVAPLYTSTPPLSATEEIEYSYTPTFNGTPPGLHVVSGPAGMYVDSTTWTVRWTPTNEQALQGSFNIQLRAENGAGAVNQNYTVNVANVNDPPASFALFSPPNDTTLSFVGNDPTILFSWAPSADPDLDTLRYTLELDTVNTFNSPALRDTATGTATSVVFTLPRVSRNYFWRSMVSDGHVTIVSQGFRRVVVSFVTTVPGPEERPLQSALWQNYPNPFNPSTNIKFQIAHSNFVSLRVFDLLGRDVATLVNEVKQPGSYEVSWDVSGVPSGVYFYRLRAGSFTDTRRMMVLR